MYAHVADAKQEFGLSDSVKIGDDGSHKAVLRVASRDGGFIVVAETFKPGDPLAPGDLVIWVPLKKVDAATSETDRTGWVGYIAAKVRPELSPRKSDIVICSYT
jgi:hypothetical protein